MTRRRREVAQNLHRVSVAWEDSEVRDQGVLGAVIEVLFDFRKKILL